MGRWVEIDTIEPEALIDGHVAGTHLVSCEIRPRQGGLALWGMIIMGYFRHPKTQRERKADQALRRLDDLPGDQPKGRLRSGKKGGGLPTERDDKTPAAGRDRARGKASHSPTRKASAKARDKLFE